MIGFEALVFGGFVFCNSELWVFLFRRWVKSAGAVCSRDMFIVFCRVFAGVVSCCGCGLSEIRAVRVWDILYVKG